MLEELQQHLEDVVVGPAISHQNLTVYPLFAPPGGPRVFTLVEGLKQKTAEVTEVSESGSVPELLVKNHGELPLLILDGEELVGAKQNRILNTSILVKAGAFVKVPVSCIEAGRWNRVSREFCTHERIMPAAMRSAKSTRVTASLKSARGYDADQRTVWSEVESYSRSRGVHSSTSALTDTLVADLAHVDEYVEAIPSQDGQVGLAAYVDGRFLGLDLVGRPEVYASAHKRLLRSYSAEALLTNAGTRRRSLQQHHSMGSRGSAGSGSRRPSGAPRTIAVDAVQVPLDLGVEPIPVSSATDEDVGGEHHDPLDLLRETLKGEFSRHVSPGSGVDLRLEAPRSQLSALWVDEGIAHLAAYPAA